MPPYTTVYGNNNFEVIELSLAGEFVENCVLPLGASDDCNQFFTLEEDKLNANNTYTDILGRVVDRNNYGIVFDIYNDGKMKKGICWNPLNYNLAFDIAFIFLPIILKPFLLYTQNH